MPRLTSRVQISFPAPQFRRLGQVVRRRPAKPLFSGSNPEAASKKQKQRLTPRVNRFFAFWAGRSPARLAQQDARRQPRRGNPPPVGRPRTILDSLVQPLFWLFGHGEAMQGLPRKPSGGTRRSLEPALRLPFFCSWFFGSHECATRLRFIHFPWANASRGRVRHASWPPAATRNPSSGYQGFLFLGLL